MPSYRVISGDSHVIETSDVWIERALPRFKDLVPHVEAAEPGALDHHGRPQKDFWVCEGQQIVQFGGDPKTGVRFDDPMDLLKGHRGDEFIVKGAFIPEEHVKDNELDGVDVSIVYPTIGIYLFGIQASPLMDRNLPRLQRLDRRLVQFVPRQAQGHSHDQPRRRGRGGQRNGTLPARWASLAP